MRATQYRTHLLVGHLCFSWIYGCGGDVVMSSSAGSGGSVTGITSSSGGCATTQCDGSASSVEIFAAQQAWPIGVALDDEAVYWVNMVQRDPEPAVGGMVMRLKKGGGEPEVLAKGMPQPVDIAVDDTRVHWSTTGGEVGSVLKTGGATVLEFDGNKQLIPVATDGEYVYTSSLTPCELVRASIAEPHESLIISGADCPLDIVADSNAAYWTGYHGVMKLDHEKTKAVAVYKTDNQGGHLYFFGIAIDTERLYFSSWLEADGCTVEGHILSLSRSGDKTVTNVADVDGLAGRLAVDKEFVYWTEVETGRVMKAPKVGGSPVTIACDQPTPLGVVVDENAVYWANGDGGTIMRAWK